MSKMGLSMNLDCCSIKTQTAAANYLWISTLTSVHHSQRASKLFFFCTFVGLPTIKIQNKTKNAAANSGQDKLQFELFKPQNVSLEKNLGLRFFVFSLCCLRKSQKNISDFKNVCCCVLHRLLLRFPQWTAPPKFASVKPLNFSSELFPKFTHQNEADCLLFTLLINFMEPTCQK